MFHYSPREAQDISKSTIAPPSNDGITINTLLLSKSYYSPEASIFSMTSQELADIFPLRRMGLPHRRPRKTSVTHQIIPYFLLPGRSETTSSRIPMTMTTPQHDKNQRRRRRRGWNQKKMSRTPFFFLNTTEPTKQQQRTPRAPACLILCNHEAQ